MSLDKWLTICQMYLSHNSKIWMKSLIFFKLTVYINMCKVFWEISTFILGNQRHWTHILCWNMQRLVEWSEHLFWEIRGTGLTPYVGTYKGWLSDQNISSEKSEALDSHPMLEHAKIDWVIRISLLKNQRHWTYILCWNIQMLYKWLALSSKNTGTGWTHRLY